MKVRLTIWHKDGTKDSAVMDYDRADRRATMAETEKRFDHLLIEPVQGEK